MTNIIDERVAGPTINRDQIPLGNWAEAIGSGDLYYRESVFSLVVFRPKRQPLVVRIGRDSFGSEASFRVIPAPKVDITIKSASEIWS